MIRPARVLGAATAAYAVSTLVSPKVLAGPTELTDSRGKAGARGATFIRALGVRDVASGLAIALAPRGTPLQLALALRIAADLGDAVVFGATAPPSAARGKSAAGAAAWGGLNLLALLHERR